MTGLAEHARRVARRSRAFYAAREPGHFLVGVSIGVAAPRTPPLHQFDLPAQIGQWLDCRLALYQPQWAAKAGLDDDVLPAMYPRFGVAEHSAWLGMAVRLQEDTTLPVPAVERPEDLERIAFSEEAPWFGYMKASYDHLRRRQDGTFFLASRGTMSPMDMANALRGDVLFEDFLLRPQFAHRLMRRMTEAVRWYYPRMVAWADRIEEGHIIGGVAWMGPSAIGHLSNDAAMLCSPQVYAEFGLPYEQEVVAGYRHVFYHVHNEKMHYVPQLCRLPGLALLEVTQDPRTLPIMEDLARIFASTGSAALMLPGTSAQVRAHLDELKARNCFLTIECRDRQDAQEILGLVRRHSRPLE